MTFLLCPTLANGSLAHFEDAFGRHGVFRYHDDKHLVLCIYPVGEQDETSNPEERLLLDAKTTVKLTAQLEAFSRALRSDPHSTRLVIEGDYAGSTYKIYADKNSVIPMLKAFRKAHHFLTVQDRR